MFIISLALLTLRKNFKLNFIMMKKIIKCIKKIMLPYLDMWLILFSNQLLSSFKNPIFLALKIKRINNIKNNNSRELKNNM